MLLGLALAATIGATNPAVTPASIHQTICVPGWSTAQRPPNHVMHAIKVTRWNQLPQPRKAFGAYILDHIIPLEIGGCALCPENLQLQTKKDAAAKDRVENELHHHVCAGTTNLGIAQDIMRMWPLAK